MAEILIAEVMEELELDQDGISVNDAAEMISQLSLEIPDEQNQIQFKNLC